MNRGVVLWRGSSTSERDKSHLSAGRSLCPYSDGPRRARLIPFIRPPLPVPARPRAWCSVQTVDASVSPPLFAVGSSKAQRSSFQTWTHSDQTSRDGSVCASPTSSFAPITRHDIGQPAASSVRESPLPYVSLLSSRCPHRGRRRPATVQSPLSHLTLANNGPENSHKPDRFIRLF